MIEKNEEFKNFAVNTAMEIGEKLWKKILDDFFKDEKELRLSDAANMYNSVLFSSMKCNSMLIGNAYPEFKEMSDYFNELLEQKIREIEIEVRKKFDKGNCQ